MTRRAYWFSILFSVLFSGSWTLWTWHDTTCADCGEKQHIERTQFPADHAASIGYMLARVALTLVLLEFIRANIHE